MAPANGLRHASSLARFHASGSALSSTVSMIRAFNYRAVVNKSSKSPAVKREIGPAGRMAVPAGVCVAMQS